MAVKSKRRAPVTKRQISRRKQSILPANLPLDLCEPGAVTTGFNIFEPINNFSSSLLIASDTVATPKTLAADSLCHLVEGWRYLASAVFAFLSHASGPSIHQAYYAELRAAFSLFSTSGIRIKFPTHEYLNKKGAAHSPSWRTAPTHKLAWVLWEKWAQSSFADSLFSDDMKIHPSITIRQLQQGIQVPFPSAALKNWGFDLATLQNDHNARNVSSYEPYWTQKSLTSMSDDDFAFVTELWHQLQPTNSGLQFEISLAHFFIDLEITEQNRLSPGIFDEASWYNSLITCLNQTTGVGYTEIAALLQARPFSTRPFLFANDQKTEAKNVLSRALFLLRLATLAVDKNFSVYPESNGKRWMKNWLIHAGLWNDQTVQLPTDVWADFESLLHAVSPGIPLPHSIFNEDLHAGIMAKLVRPEANLAWSLQL